VPSPVFYCRERSPRFAGHSHILHTGNNFQFWKLEPPHAVLCAQFMEIAFRADSLRQPPIIQCVDPFKLLIIWHSGVGQHVGGVMRNIVVTQAWVVRRLGIPKPRSTRALDLSEELYPFVPRTRPRSFLVTTEGIENISTGT